MKQRWSLQTNKLYQHKNRRSWPEILNPNTNRILLVKRDSSGTKEWIKELGISDEESGISMSVDSSENIYVTGYSGQEHEANKNQGQFEVFLTKYNSSGTKEWTKQLGNSETEYGGRD